MVWDSSCRDDDSNVQVAIWLFLNPHYLTLTHASLKDEYHWDIETDEAPAAFAYTEASLLQLHLHIVARMHRNAFIVLYQRSGDVVVGEPGWPHAVANLKRNVKLATETYDQHELHLYEINAQMQSHFQGLPTR